MSIYFPCKFFLLSTEKKVHFPPSCIIRYIRALKLNNLLTLKACCALFGHYWLGGEVRHSLKVSGTAGSSVLYVMCRA